MEYNSITNCGCVIANMSPITRQLVIHELTVSPTPTTHCPRPRCFKMFTERDGVLYIPTQFAIDKFAHMNFHDTRTPGKTHECNFQGSLRDNQNHAVTACIDLMNARGGAVMCIPTGGGKTACALYISCKFHAKTLIIVHKTLLAHQWKERINTFVPSATISMIQGDVFDTSGDYVIATIQTLLSRKYDPSKFTCFRMLIFDEAHHVAAPSFSECIQFLQCPLTLGLTATPHRKDGLERIIYWTLGPLAYKEAMKHRDDVIVQPIWYSCDTYRKTLPPVNTRGTIDNAALLRRLVNDAQRTDKIVQHIASLCPTRQILVLSHRRDHCKSLAHALAAKFSQNDVSLYLDKSRDATKRIVVATYAMVGEGFDEPRLNTLVLATPASDVTQAVGRILRTNGATSTQPCIIDVVDTWSPCFAQYHKRKKQYVSSGFHVR